MLKSDHKISSPNSRDRNFKSPSSLLLLYKSKLRSSSLYRLKILKNIFSHFLLKNTMDERKNLSRIQSLTVLWHMWIFTPHDRLHGCIPISFNYLLEKKLKVLFSSFSEAAQVFGAFKMNSEDVW